jgi:hypothetical protein
VHVRRVGDRDLEDAVFEGVRDRADALEHVQGHLGRRDVVDPHEREIDEWQLVTRRQHPSDALARCDALLDERGRQGARLPRPTTGKCELVVRNELRRREQVDDELGGLVDAVRRRERRRRLQRLTLRLAKRREVGLAVAHGVVIADVTFVSLERVIGTAPPVP